MAIDIDWRVDDENRILSNLAEKRFTFRGERVNSIEAVLQSIKIQDPAEQATFWQAPGFWCKKMGRKLPWQQTRLLWWKGVPMDRDGQDYQDFLDELFVACYMECPKFKEALIISRDHELTHSIGSTDQDFTILTQQEFLDRLNGLRDLACKTVDMIAAAQEIKNPA